MMRLPPTRLAALAVGLTVLLLQSLACGGGEEPVTPGAIPQPTPAGTGSETITPSNIDAPIIDLATTSALTVVYAVGEGDLRSDQPGLAAGDVNDDGIDDIVVGARFADGPDSREDSGAAYISFGSQSPLESIDLVASQQDVTIIGARAGDNLGFSIVIADLNGDGSDDVVLAAPFGGAPDQPSRKPGRVYIFFSGPGLPERLDLAQDGADVTITGITDTSFFGDSMAEGDVNGDGTADLIIGATFGRSPGEDGTPVRGGAVYVFMGRQSWPPALSTDDSDIAMYGADDFDELGDFVTSGDINGDGFDDIIATAEAADGPDNARPTSAEVHVVFGGDAIEGTVEIARDQQDLSVYGAAEQDTLGFSLASGDIDGDGIDDLIMGARLGNGPGNTISRAGQVYIVPGSAQLPSSIDLADPPDFVTVVHGQNQSDFLGSNETVADLDGDGRNELILGSGFADAPPRADSGAVYIVEEAPIRGSFLSVGAQALRAVVYGAAAGDRLGANVIAADFNGDGRQELIVVAEGAAGPGESRPGVGRVYVISLPR